MLEYISNYSMHIKLKIILLMRYVRYLPKGNYFTIVQQGRMPYTEKNADINDTFKRVIVILVN